MSEDQHYLRYDASALAPLLMATDEAIDGGQGGAMHTVQYWVRVAPDDTKGWLIPLRSGQRAPGPGIQYPAPYRDVAVKNRPGLTLCDVWRSENGLPDAAVCPTNVPLSTYSVLVANTAGGEWLAAWPGRTGINLTVRVPQCSAPQTPTATKTPTPVPATPTPTPIPGPNPYAAWIEQLWRDGITAGCGNGLFCPDWCLTREQAAVWLLRAKYGPNYVPPPCVGVFRDVVCVTP